MFIKLTKYQKINLRNVVVLEKSKQSLVSFNEKNIQVSLGKKLCLRNLKWNNTAWKLLNTYFNVVINFNRLYLRLWSGRSEQFVCYWFVFVILKQRTNILSLCYFIHISTKLEPLLSNRLLFLNYYSFLNESYVNITWQIILLFYIFEYLAGI